MELFLVFKKNHSGEESAYNHQTNQQKTKKTAFLNVYRVTKSPRIRRLKEGNG
jgi:hypothetical protein